MVNNHFEINSNFYNEFKNNYWKTARLFMLAVVAAAFSSSLSQAIAVQAQAISEATIEERLTIVREKLKQRELQIASESDTRSSPQEKPETEEKKLFLSQWGNYWPNWPKYWNDWNDWNNWQDWNNWRNWGNWW